MSNFNGVVIETRNLNVYYGDKHVLKDISVRIPEKRITAVMGPSGCGKTTFIKCLNRLIDLVDEARVSGEVLFRGVNIYASNVDVTYIRRKIGMVFQKPNPLPMSIYDNVAYGLKIHGIKDKEVLNKIVEKCLREVGLWDEVKDRLKEPASKLSGGQQQRLCIARALAVEPEVLLLDEPTASLDPLSANKIEKLLLRLKKQYSIVIVTHNVHQALRLADYVIFIYLGEVVEHGPSHEVFMKPKMTITRAFIRGDIS